MLQVLSVVLFAAAVAPADSAATRADSLDVVSPKVVRRFEDVIVRAQFHDPLSSETGHLIAATHFAALPASGLLDVMALQPGAVVRAGQLNVRGGRSGETVTTLADIPLAEPFRNRALELPLMAIHSAELLSGGLDAEHPGALAGVLALNTVSPSQRRETALHWQTDGRSSTHYDRLAGRISGPLARSGWGAVLAAEAELDDTHHPNGRTKGRRSIAGLDFGWRAMNRLLGYAKLAPRDGAFNLEVVVNRRVEQPYNPMFALDGYITTCADPFCTQPGFSADPQPGYLRYNGADHTVTTDDKSAAGVLSWRRALRTGIASASAAWIGTRRLISLGGNDDEAYLERIHTPFYGTPDSPTSEPFLVYLGDEPFFQKRSSQSFHARADFERITPRGNRVKGGFGARYDAVRMREIDMSLAGLDLDTLRSYRAFAPGAFAYTQGRWVFEGLVLNAGLRAEYFTAGPQADDQVFGGSTSVVWTLSPRVGVAYPISTRDVLSLAYARIRQSPARDFLYDNRDGEISHRQQIGNPNLEPATMISYQAGVKHSFDDAWSLQGAIFYRELFGLVGTREFLRAGASQPLPRYENADVGNAGGFELSLVGTSARAHAELHYTYMEAFGTQSREEGFPYGSRVLVRIPPVGEHPLDWDQRHSVALSGWTRAPGSWSFSWSTRIGSGFPWSPRTRRSLDPELLRLNSQRFKFQEWTTVRAEWNPLRGPVAIGCEVRNLFNRRNDIAATVLGYPHPEINTIYDDYAAFRDETGRGGGAYWNDANGDGLPGWVPVGDPRLIGPPRTVLLTLGAQW